MLATLDAGQFFFLFLTPELYSFLTLFSSDIDALKKTIKS